MDFHFRKYNPAIGKFTQPNTLIKNVYDPQNLNRYMFERAITKRFKYKTNLIYLINKIGEEKWKK